MDMRTLTIGQAAGELGISTHSLRYYERIGLLGPVARDASGHRRYSVEDVQRLRFLHCLRKTEMPIRGLREYAALAREGQASVEARVKLLRAHGRNLRERIQELEALLATIDQKVERLQGNT